MAAIDFHIAICSDDQESATAEVPCQVRQKLQHRLIGVMQVLQHEHDWLTHRSRCQELSDALKKSEAVFLVIAAIRWEQDTQLLESFVRKKTRGLKGRTGQLAA
jgi:hypothetical protein